EEGKGRRLLPPSKNNTAGQELAKAVASHSALKTTTGRMFKAKAFRVDELLGVLEKIAADPDALSAAAQNLLTSLSARIPGTNANHRTHKPPPPQPRPALPRQKGHDAERRDGPCRQHHARRRRRRALVHDCHGSRQRSLRPQLPGLDRHRRCRAGLWLPRE